MERYLSAGESGRLSLEDDEEAARVFSSRLTGEEEVEEEEAAEMIDVAFGRRRVAQRSGADMLSLCCCRRTGRAVLRCQSSTVAVDSIVSVVDGGS